MNIPNIVVMGVAGCGKSSLGLALANALGASYIEGDSYHPPQNIARMAAGIPLTDTDRAGWLELLAQRLASGVALGQATLAIQKAEADLQLPRAVSTAFQGNAQAFQDSLASVPLLILAALITVYLILGVLYESFIHPLTILSTLPSAGFGALAMLMLFGYEFSLIALIGTILLIGIVKKNGIMMVDFAIVAERDEGLSTVEAIRKSALLRFRPIMMTTMAALLGGVPLMLSHGTGSELRQPLGYTMVGGLIVSQALTLFTTPIVYLYLDQLSHWLSGERRPRRKPAPAPKPEAKAGPAWEAGQQGQPAE